MSRSLITESIANTNERVNPVTGAGHCERGTRPISQIHTPGQWKSPDSYFHLIFIISLTIAFFGWDHFRCPLCLVWDSAKTSRHAGVPKLPFMGGVVNNFGPSPPAFHPTHLPVVLSREFSPLWREEEEDGGR